MSGRFGGFFGICRGGGGLLCSGFLLPGAGGMYPAAALARSFIASISSFDLFDFGIGTRGMFILVTGKGCGDLSFGTSS